MPTYQYECEACGHAFDELQTMSDPKLKKCPKCHKNKLVRLIGSGSGMIFKGSGFYETDYKKKTGPSADKKEVSKPAPSASSAPIGPCGRPCSCHP
jgi:putative FmdB family regulatory protein